MAEQQVDAYVGTIFSGAGDRGSNLARLELRIALRVWHSRIPHYRVKPGTELVYTIEVRSVDSFPMVLGQSV